MDYQAAHSSNRRMISMILHPNRMRETGRSALFQGLVFKGARLRQVDAGDLDDGLPRGFLAGAIVEVWVALRLNWA